MAAHRLAFAILLCGHAFGKPVYAPATADSAALDCFPRNPMFNMTKLVAFARGDSSEGFLSRKEDVYVVTWAKSGTTLVQQMVHLLLKHTGATVGESYGETVPWIEAMCCADQFLQDREAPGASFDRLHAMKSNRFFKSHAMPKHMPGASGLEPPEPPRVIYIVRNPKDVAVSFWHHHRSKPDYQYADGAWDEFFELFLAGEVECGSWLDHVLAWHAEVLSRPSSALWLSYEDILADKRMVLRQIADFIQVHVDESVMDAVVAGSSIQTMRQDSAANIGMQHLRNGIVGSWRSTFSDAQSQRLDNAFRSKVEQLGLRVDFGDGELWTLASNFSLHRAEL